MKSTSIFKGFLIICIITIIGFSMAGCDLFNDLELDDLIGEWQGSYGANQRETGLTLTVYKEGSVNIFGVY